MDDLSRIGRRKFIELTTSIAGTGILAASMPWLSVFSESGVAARGPNEKVRIGVIGVGSRGRTLLLNLQSFADRLNVEIVAVCDTWDDHYDRAIELTEGKAEAFRDYREMLGKVHLDGVIIASPLHEHAQQTIDAMNAGVHVYCEKAMARNLEDVKRMYDTYLDTGKIMLIGHQRLVSPVFIKGIEEIQSGRIGPITMLKACWHRNRDWIFYDVPGGRGSDLDRIRNWRLYDEYSAGMITELGSHDFQSANWVLGKQPLSVMGTGNINFWNDGREVYDNFSLIFEYPDGINFPYDCITSNKHNGQQLQILGNTGMMDLLSNTTFEEVPPKPPALRTMIHNIEKNLFETIPIGGATWVPAEAVSYGGEFISDDYEMNETQLYLEAFVEFIREGSASKKLTDEGYHASVWSLLAEEATKTGTKIHLPKEYLI